MKLRETLNKHSDKLRFALVGGGNTILDFALLNLLALVFGLPDIVGNTISTTICMCISFILNKKFTFKSKGKNYMREVLLFFAFTIFGLWVLQNGIIFVINAYIPIPDDFWRLNIAKILASSVSLCWNYITYKKFVFKTDRDQAPSE